MVGFDCFTQQTPAVLGSVMINPTLIRGNIPNSTLFICCCPYWTKAAVKRCWPGASLLCFYFFIFYEYTPFLTCYGHCNLVTCDTKAFPVEMIDKRLAFPARLQRERLLPNKGPLGKDAAAPFILISFSAQAHWLEWCSFCFFCNTRTDDGT